MKPLNPKSKLAQSLAAATAALTPADLPTAPSRQFQRAQEAFRDALNSLFHSFDVKSYGYCELEGHWHVSVDAPNIFNICDLVDGSRSCPYFISGEVGATGATPEECVANITWKFNAAMDWQRKVTSLLNLEVIKAQKPQSV